MIDLVKILNKLNKSVIFKLHPIKNSKYYRVILSKYAKFKWYESKKNLIEITQNCLCLITHPYSAAGFDFLLTLLLFYNYGQLLIENLMLPQVMKN